MVESKIPYTHNATTYTKQTNALACAAVDG
jgi:hypothetical protein